MTENEEPNTLRLVVVFLRFYARLTQAEFGKAAGVEQALVSRYEAGLQRPPEESLRRMAAAVGVSWPMVMYVRHFYSSVLRLTLRRGEPAGSALDETLDRITAAMAPHLAETLSDPDLWATPEEERSEADEIWANLQRFSTSRRRELVRLMGMNYPSWAVAERICESCRAAVVFDDPKGALELAELALAVAAFEDGGEEWRSRVEGYCWAHIGHALRAIKEDASAKKAFARAWELWRAGVADPDRVLDESVLLELERA